MTNIEVYIPLQSSSNLGAMMEWAKEQNIIIKKAIPRHSENAFGRGMIYGFAFEFETMEDATAFKLKWL